MIETKSMAICGEQYVHTLIPDRVDLAPQPHLIVSFFEELRNLGAAPLQAEVVVLKPSGEFRTGLSPVTGEPVSVPARKLLALGNITEIPQAVGGLDHYDVRISGEGPPGIPPFQLLQADNDGVVEFGTKMKYDLTLACCQRPQPVSTSAWEDKDSPYKPPLFDTPCSLYDRTGFFARPPDATLVMVPSAGSARFWIEFEFGGWIFPRIKNNFDVLNPTIVNCAEQVFACKFVQGCNWL